jgi:hypothetical protein
VVAIASFIGLLHYGKRRVEVSESRHTVVEIEPKKGLSRVFVFTNERGLKRSVLRKSILLDHTSARPVAQDTLQ